MVTMVDVEQLRSLARVGLQRSCAEVRWSAMNLVAPERKTIIAAETLIQIQLPSPWYSRQNNVGAEIERNREAQKISWTRAYEQVTS